MNRLNRFFNGLPALTLFLLLGPVSTHAGAGVRVSGRVSELIGTNQITRSYVAVIHGSDYSLMLFDSQSNLVSTAVRKSRDTFVLSHIPSGNVGGDGIYEAALAATPYPLNAPDSLQMVWISLLAKKSVLSSMIARDSLDSPGIVLSHLITERHLNWYEFMLTNVVFANGGDGLVRDFTQYTPGNMLMGLDELTKAGLDKSLVSNLAKAGNGKIIVPLAGAASNGYPILQFEAVGNFGATAYPDTATLKRFNSPQPDGTGGILRQFNFSVTEARTVEDGIEMPPVPKWVTVADFRTRGIRGKPDSYVLKDATKWPLGSAAYRTATTVLKMAARQKNAVPGLITLIVLGAVALLLFVVFRSKRQKSK